MSVFSFHLKRTTNALPMPFLGAESSLEQSGEKKLVINMTSVEMTKLAAAYCSEGHLIAFVSEYILKFVP